METKQQVHNLIILDESGSMDSIKDAVIQGFNEIVQTIKGIAEKFPEQEHYISLVSFNGLGRKELHFVEPVKQLKEINSKKYNPDASTPLYDAIGFSIAKLKQSLYAVPNHKVLVTILTDGAENASQEYTGATIKKIINDLKAIGWTFTYIGTDHDVENSAVSISINNTMVFQKNKEDIRRMFAKERFAREKFSQKIRRNENTSEGFYDEDDDTVI